MKFSIEQAEYHRNGVGGEGFYTGIATCDVEHCGPQRMLVTFFPRYDDEGAVCPARENKNGEYANPRVAVINLDRLSDLGVSIGNKWRGDNFCEVADAIVKEVSA